MRIEFIIGSSEQHEMELSFDQNSGDLEVLVDGAQVLQDSPLLGLEPVKTYEVSVGELERHTLAFQVMYGCEPDSPELETETKLRLMVKAVM